MFPSINQLSKIYIADLIPLDLVLHFIVGLSICIFSLKKGLSYPKTIWLLFAIALLKEIHDWMTAYPANLFEYVSDFSVTLIYAILLYPTRKLKRHLQKKEEQIKKIKIY